MQGADETRYAGLIPTSAVIPASAVIHTNWNSIVCLPVKKNEAPVRPFFGGDTMRKTLVGLLVAATAGIGLTAAPVQADILYISSGGTVHQFGAPVVTMPTVELERTIVAPGVIEPVTTQVITQPAVIQQPVVTTPVIQTVDVEPRRSLFHLGLWPLIDLRLF
jgi:hypothetical protein